MIKIVLTNALGEGEWGDCDRPWHQYLIAMNTYKISTKKDAEAVEYIKRISESDEWEGEFELFYKDVTALNGLYFVVVNAYDDIQFYKIPYSDIKEAKNALKIELSQIISAYKNNQDKKPLIIGPLKTVENFIYPEIPSDLVYKTPFNKLINALIKELSEPGAFYDRVGEVSLEDGMGIEHFLFDTRKASWRPISEYAEQLEEEFGDVSLNSYDDYGDED